MARLWRSLLAVVVVLGVPTRALALAGPDTQGCWAFSDTIAPTDVNAPTFAFTDISATGTQASLPNTSTMAGPFPIGFSFGFYGATYTQFSISPNGFITFLPGQPANSFFMDIPSVTTPNGMVVGFWSTALNIPAGGAVYYQTIGSAPSRRLVVQYQAIQTFDNDPQTFEVVLNETGGDIVVQYVHAADGMNSAVLGIENAAGTIGLQRAFTPYTQTDITLDNQAIRYYPVADDDADGDGRIACIDNCPNTFNPSQSDCDGDGIGDACDPDAVDSDGDGLFDGCDLCPSNPDPACPKLYACDGGPGTSSLWSVNPTTGVATVIGSMVNVRRCSGLAFDAAGTLYAVGGQVASSNTSLYTVDTTTGVATLVGPVTTGTRITDISFRSDGTLFGFEPTSAELLVTINTSTGAATVVGDHNLFRGGNGIAFDDADVLYHADTEALHTLDQTTAAATVVTPLEYPFGECLSFDPRFNALDFAGGTLFGMVQCGDAVTAGSDSRLAILHPNGTMSTRPPTVNNMDGIAVPPCGNGIVDPGEQCDPGTPTNGACCSASCQFQPSGTPCVSDGNVCTDDVCDAGGVCGHVANTASCEDGDPCTTGDVCSGGACTSGTVDLDACADDFLCYKIKSTGFAPLQVTLADQFETAAVDVVKPKALCPPADKAGEGIHDAATHLAGYTIKQATVHVRQTNLLVTNQLGELRVDTVRPDLLLVPTAKSLVGPATPPDPGSHAVDHFKCYKVKVTAGTPKFPKGVQVSVADQFTSPAKLFDLKKPKHLCTPADENGSGIKDTRRHLLCYQAKPAKGQPKHVKVTGVNTANEIGADFVTTVKEQELCIPSEKTP